MRTQIANLPIRRLIPLSQIAKCLRCASPQIADQQIFMINPLIANREFREYTAHLSLKTVLVNFLKRGYATFVRRKNMYLQNCESFKSARKAWVPKSQIHKLQARKITKRLGPQTQTAKCHSCGRSANLTKSANLWILDLQNIFADCPPLLYSLDRRNTLVLLPHNLVWTASLLLRVFTS